MLLFLCDLSICARDSDASIEAGPVVRLNNVPSVHLQTTNNVVWYNDRTQIRSSVSMYSVCC